MRIIQCQTCRSVLFSIEPKGSDFELKPFKVAFRMGSKPVCRGCGREVDFKASEPECIRCGRCCIINGKDCKYLIRHGTTTECTVYSTRLGRDLGDGFVCVIRPLSLINPPGCPFSPNDAFSASGATTLRSTYEGQYE